MIRQALLGVCVALSLGSMASAQNSNSSSGPHDPNPPVNAPDLRLAPPCAPGPNVAVATPTDPVQNVPSASAALPASAQYADTQCAGTGVPGGGGAGSASRSDPIKN